MALLTAARDKAVAVVPELRDRLAAKAATTPGRLTVMMLVVGLLGLIAGVASVVGAAQRADLVESVATRSGPLTVQAQQLYRSLSDADATAAAAFLSSGAEPPALRERYRADIAAASAALAAATAATEGGVEQDAVARIAAALPVYTGLVETARSYNRLNLPIGAAYLREASGLMRAQLLPAAAELYQAETDRLAAERDGASGLPWVAVPLLLLTLAGLVVIQVHLTRRTRRLINIGLAGATSAGLAALIWVGASWAGVMVNLAAADRDGSAQVEVMAEARIAALRARADEALTLVARGSGAAFEESFAANMGELSTALERARAEATDPTVREALDAASVGATDWRAVHATVRELDDRGESPQAVALAVGAGGTGDEAATETDNTPDNPPGDATDAPESAASAFNRVDAALAAGIASADATFADRARRADRALGGAAAGLTVLTLAVLVGLVAGIQQRIAEYR